MTSLHGATAMPRHAFKTGIPYPARLLAADTRTIENDKSRKLALVRLEFEIFQAFELDRGLRSTGQIACRDLVIHPDAAGDNGVVYFAGRLGVRHPHKPDAWSARAADGAWVETVFGDVDPSDDRNRFAKISSFSRDGYRVVEYHYEQADHWVTPEAAAGVLKLSAATIRRRVNEHLPDWGEALERRTHGGHRRINLLLLRHLLKDPAWHDSVRILQAQRIRELEQENSELKLRLRER
jgi:hypothetical protein